eukprot:6184406-Pleurochrysis_carterae.AAC.3
MVSSCMIFFLQNGQLAVDEYPIARNRAQSQIENYFECFQRRKNACGYTKHAVAFCRCPELVTERAATSHARGTARSRTVPQRVWCKRLSPMPTDCQLLRLMNRSSAMIAHRAVCCASLRCRDKN